MKLYSLLCFLFIASFAKAQNKITIPINVEVVNDSERARQIYSGNGIGLDTYDVPKFVFQQPKSRGGEILDYTFVVKRQKKIGVNELLCSEEYLLGTPNLKMFTVKEVTKEYITVTLNPIYKNLKNEIFQIQEIEINYNLGSTSPSRFSIANKVNAINNTSLLSTGTWYKIGVDKTGVCKIDYNFLRSLGVDVDNINPKNIRILGFGGQVLPEDLAVERTDGLTENAITVLGEEDNVFDRDDVVLFYAQGTLSWDLKNRNSITHQQNIYTNLGHYFINVDSGVRGKRIQNTPNISQNRTKSITTFTDYQLHEQELFNYIRVGRQWFGENFTVDNSQTFSFDFPNLVKDTDVSLSGIFGSNSRSVQTEFSVSYLGRQLIQQSIPRATSRELFRTAAPRTTFSSNEDVINLNINYNSRGDNSAESRLDYLRVVADRELIATGNQFGFVNFESLTNNDVLEYTIQQKENVDFIWNVTDNYNVKNVLNSESNTSNFKFKEITDGVLNTYHLVNVTNAFSPINLGGATRVINQNILELEDVQYVIISNKELIPQANRLKEYHENNTNVSDVSSSKIKVAVVDVEQIYNEFGSGNADVTAIRNYLKYIYDKSLLNENKLKYVCLFGDASFDSRNIQTTSFNNIPSFMSPSSSSSLRASYNTDDYYAYMDEEGAISPLLGWRLDLVTGRIPVSTVNQATTIVDKILRYYSSRSFGNWKNQITLLGDDGQEDDSQGLIRFLNNSADRITGFTNTSGIKIPGNDENLNVVKLYSDAFEEQVTSGGESYPEIKRRFLEAFDNGSLVINYFGHGNVFALGEENFLDISDVQQIRNLNNLPLFITVTCDFSRFDDPVRVSGGEELILGSLGGAVSMITTTRQIGISSGANINNRLSDYLYRFDGKTRTIAEGLKDTKNVITSSDEFFVFFLGDPLMDLSIPTNKIKVTSVKKYPTSNSEDDSLEPVTSLQALARHQINGEITDTNNQIISSFNGNLDVIIFGEELARSTRLNEEGGVTPANQSRVVNYTSLENRLFSGAASVKDGKFSFDVILPKDIGFIEENSKFSLYASSSNTEAVGFDKTFVVGGVDENVEEDTTPPVVNLFLNDISFVEGGSTTSTPILIAQIQDQNGINTTLNSIGHNISLVIDNNFNAPINLNDFYTTENDNFQQGVVNFQLEELEEGNHILTLKAWDTHNNSTTQTLNFFVTEDNQFQIDRVLNYPNPFIDYTEFWFSNNRINNPLEIKVQVYTVSGKLVKTILSTSANTGGIVRNTVWDGKDDFGNRIGKGVYVYKITVKETNTGETDEKIEKLVIL